MLVSLMILASSHEFICLEINLKFSKNFRSSKILLNGCLTRKPLSSNLTWGGGVSKIKYLFVNNLVSHHVSCPYAHQQNGSAERKYHHIVEVGISLLAHASMPLKYWDEAFLAATYLINRLPTKILDFCSPL
jgi:hypothetical protein